MKPKRERAKRREAERERERRAKQSHDHYHCPDCGVVWSPDDFESSDRLDPLDPESSR